MKYTYQEYEAFYYLHKLLPVLQNYSDFEENLYYFNRKRKGEPFVNFKVDRESRQSVAEFTQKMIDFLTEQAPNYLKQPLPVQRKNIKALVNLFKLSEEEEKLISFITLVRRNRLLHPTMQRFTHEYYENKDFLETVAGLEIGALQNMFKSSAPLLRLGILERFRWDVAPSPWLNEFINSKYTGQKGICRQILGNPIEDKNILTPKDFTYIEAADLALRLIKKTKSTKGFNILLYGAPGTGKTSFAKLLAKTGKLLMYPAGLCSEGDDERNYRLKQLYRKQFLLEKIKDTCILFDEAEDIFSSFETRTSKMEINNLLENNKVPVIWTTNKIHLMDPAYIRRFTLAVCFNKPPLEVRQKIWSKYLTENKIPCTANDTRLLAKKYEAVPSMIAGAAQAARMTKGGLNTVKEHLSFMTQAMHGGYKKPEETKKEEKFFPSLIHADMDLNALTAQLKGLGRLNFSLCLYGASGTGKSAYARHLAQELGLEVLHRRASDLIGPYVGQTEHNIAQAFAQAKENKSLLIFDEADTFLRDRALAMRSWEVSSVNEMLTWMESHPYPFICTTNLMDTLDPASLRRFSFKVKYDFLTPEQVREAFDCFFGLKISLNDIYGLDKLTPGDFALVKNKAEILGTSAQFAAVKEMLENEQKLKRNTNQSGIGFCL